MDYKKKYLKYKLKYLKLKKGGTKPDPSDLTTREIVEVMVAHDKAEAQKAEAQKLEESIKNEELGLGRKELEEINKEVDKLYENDIIEWIVGTSVENLEKIIKNVETDKLKEMHNRIQREYFWEITEQDRAREEVERRRLVGEYEELRGRPSRVFSNINQILKDYGVEVENLRTENIETNF